MADQVKTSLSKAKTVDTLRIFLYTGFFWAIYGQIAGIITPVFTGFALFLGAKESQIGIIASFVALAGLAQLFSLFLAKNVKKKSLFIIWIGFVEIIITLSVIFIPLVFPERVWLVSLIILVSIGTIMGNIVSPLFNNWFVTVIPQNMRARYISKRMVIIYLTATATAYLIGRFLDTVGGYKGFAWVFSLGIFAGLAGYIVLFKAHFPEMEKFIPSGFLQTLFTPFKNKKFRRLLLFYISWVFAVGIAQPFYTVFMLKRLELSYSTIAIFNNIQMISFILGLRFWGKIIDQYGNKPILQILMVPRVLIPIMWIFNCKNNFSILPVIMVLSGLVFSGLTVAINNFLFGIVPKGEEKVGFFASWAATVSVVNFFAPLIGGHLVSCFKPLNFNIINFPVGNLQIVFLISALFLLIPVFLLQFVSEERTSSPGYLLGQIRRGNLFAFAYNSFLFSIRKEEKKRAQAISAMGNSKSPIAINILTKALDDLSPRVRIEAVKALGKMKRAEAIPHLLAKFNDEESDIRPEIAQAIGKIKSKEGIKTLLKALDDPDLRVRNSAALSLSEIGDEEAKNLLFEKLSCQFNRFTFPTFVEALSKLGERKIIPIAIAGLERYTSPVIRLQILNSICRVLGAENKFYKLVIRDELEQVQKINKMLKETYKKVSEKSKFPQEFKQQILFLLKRIQTSFREDEQEEFLNNISQLIFTINRYRLNRSLLFSDISLVNAHLKAIQSFLSLKKIENIKPQGIGFLVICVYNLIEILTRKKHDEHSGLSSSRARRRKDEY